MVPYLLGFGIQTDAPSAEEWRLQRKKGELTPVYLETRPGCMQHQLIQFISFIPLHIDTPQLHQRTLTPTNSNNGPPL
jgi:hypothetical protein